MTDQQYAQGEIKYCPIHGEALPCMECRGDGREKTLLIEFMQVAAISAKIDPLRLTLATSSLVDVLKAVENYLDRFDEIMIGAGKAKKEGLDTTGLVEKVRDIQTELHMYATLARLRLGR